MDVAVPVVALLPLLAGADVPVVDEAEETLPAELPEDSVPPEDEEPVTVARQTRRPSCSTQR